ncbi:MAG: AraC family transcriptional regulator [Rhizobacter sp.]
MRAADLHRCRLVPTPWPGVHGTHIESTRHYGRHWHDTYGFGVLEHGAHRSASGRGCVDAYAGDLITTNPGEVHDGHPLGAASRRWRMVYLEPHALVALTGAAPDVALARPVFHDPRLRGALQRLFARLDAAPPDRLACDEAIVEALGLLLDAHATTSPRQDAGGDVRRARDRLADETAHAPTLAELAETAGLGKYQLLRRFEAAYGMPPHAWLRAHRAERARSLIARGASLAQAAADCGYADQSHMTRLFVRQFGYTPGAWREAVTARAPQ